MLFCEITKLRNHEIAKSVTRILVLRYLINWFDFFHNVSSYYMHCTFMLWDNRDMLYKGHFRLAQSIGDISDMSRDGDINFGTPLP